MNLVTKESLERDRIRREREHREIADAHDAAADLLEEDGRREFRTIISKLRSDAEVWRKGIWRS